MTIRILTHMKIDAAAPTSSVIVRSAYYCVVKLEFSFLPSPTKHDVYYYRETLFAKKIIIRERARVLQITKAANAVV